MKRKFVAYFWFSGWDCFSVGIHICPSLPNMEIHVPFGFVRVGWKKQRPVQAINYDSIKWRKFGYDPGNS